MAETIVYVKESAQDILKGISYGKTWCVAVLSAMGTIISLKRVSAVLTDATCRILFYFMFPSYLFLMEQFVEDYYFLENRKNKRTFPENVCLVRKG